jgi:hypothetical protein
VFGKFLTGNGFTKAADPENGLWQDERGALIKIMQNLIAVREFLAVRSGRQQRAMNNPRAIWSAFEKAHPETTGKSAKAAPQRLKDLSFNRRDTAKDIAMPLVRSFNEQA